MNNIIERENEQSSIEKLGAQKVIYSRAKLYFVFQTLIAVVIVVILSVIQSFNNTEITTTILVTYCLLALVADIFFEKLICGLKEKAAKIQELFDTYVLEISWNEILIPAKPEFTDIYEFYSQFSGDKDKLIDWYSPDISAVKGNTAILLCQKSNCNYDASIRKFYNKLIAAVAISALVIILICSLIAGLTISGFLILLFPTMPIIQWFYKQFNHNKESIKKLNELTDSVNLAWDKIKESKHIDKIELRNIQDKLYLNRVNNPLIPDWLYYKLRDKNEAAMHYTVKELIQELKKNKLTD